MTKNIIKRVISGVLIVLILSFLKGCKVNAASYISPGNCYHCINATCGGQCNSINSVVGPIAGSDLGVNNNDNLWYFRFNINSGQKLYVSGLVVLQYQTPPGQSNPLNTTPIIYFNNSACDVQYSYTQGWGQYGTYDMLGTVYSYSCEYVDVISGYNNYLSIRTETAIRGSYITQLAYTNMYDENDISSINTKLEENKQEIINNTNAIVDTNDTIKDDSVDDPQDHSSNVATNGVITQLITLPITLYQKLLNSTSSSCTPFNLGSLYGSNLTMPCINLENYLGNGLYNVIDILISGLFIYSISRKMIKVFNSLSSMKEGDVING